MRPFDFSVLRCQSLNSPCLGCVTKASSQVTNSLRVYPIELTGAQQQAKQGPSFACVREICFVHWVLPWNQFLAKRWYYVPPNRALLWRFCWKGTNLQTSPTLDFLVYRRFHMRWQKQKAKILSTLSCSLDQFCDFTR